MGGRISGKAGGSLDSRIDTLHTLDAGDMRRLIRSRLEGSRPRSEPEVMRFGPFPREYTSRLRHLIPHDPTPAAVLVPVIDRGSELTVLLTERSADLKHHAGQISFPGGRREDHDAGPVDVALRETEEEIGLSRDHVEIIGFLPDHLIISGYQVTPVVGFVRPDFTLTLDRTEVASVFEAPLRHLFDPRNRRPRLRRMLDIEITLWDLPYGEHNIWGATAGILLTFGELLSEA